MIKALVGKFGTLAMLAAVAGSSVVACSSDVSKGPSESSHANDGSIGSIGLKLVPVSGVTINSVNYVVTGTPAIPGTALPSGVLPTPGTDKTFNFGDLKVFVDQASLLYLEGAEVDYVESMEGSGFKFNNPNVKSTCGCGSSFSA